MGLYTASEFTQRTFPDTSLVGDGLLHEKARLMLAGETGIGKSYLALQMASALAVGGSWFGTWKVVRPLTVLYLQVEVAEGLLWKRCNRLYGDDPPANLTLWTPDEDEPVGEEEFWPTIESIALDYEVVMFDPIYMLVEGEENQVHTIRPALKRFDAIRKRGHTLILVHHTRKVSGAPVPMSIDQIRGSSAWTGWCDTVLMASKGKDNSVRLTTLKARNREAAPPPPLVLRWQEGGGDFLKPMAFDPQDPMALVFDAVEEAGEGVSRATLTRYLVDEKGVARSSAHRAIDRAVETGLLTVEQKGKRQMLSIEKEED